MIKSAVNRNTETLPTILPNITSMKYSICSECFYDEGLKLTSQKFALKSNEKCPNCKKNYGYKISKEALHQIALKYFVNGSFYQSKYGGSSLLMFNEYQKTDVDFGIFIKQDIPLIESILGIGFFYYAPRLYNVGSIAQLEKLQCGGNGAEEVLKEIIEKFPTKIINERSHFYRLRKNVSDPSDESQFDSPPIEHSGKGRLDSEDLNILYGSENIEICLHECRVSIIDDLYIAKLNPTKNLKILDLSAEIAENNTEFESLCLSIHYIFRAEENSYVICRKIAKFACLNGYDGIIFPSYFSKVKTESIPNIALFKSPIKDGIVQITSINRVRINKIDYDYSFGPLILQ